MADPQTEQRLASLEAWKEEREKQQITFPLDEKSIDALQQYFIQVVGDGNFTRIDGVTGDNFFFIRNRNRSDRIGVYGVITPYSVDVTSNIFTAINHGYSDGDQVQVFAQSNIKGFSASAPAPLATQTPYYIINSTQSTFQLSDTFGGTALNITDIGNGANYLSSY